MNPLRIAFVTSEVTPYSKTGGLADVSGALPGALRRAGHDVRVFTPLYSSIETESHDFRPVPELRNLSVSIGERRVAYSVYETRTRDADVPVYFLHCPAFYDRDGLYTDDPDESSRFILLQRGTLEICQRLAWGPDIVHGNDWQTGLLPLYIKTIYAWDQLFRKTRSVFTIHNIGYQGTFPASILPDTGLEPCRKYLHQKDLKDGRIGFLRTGLTWADLLTTVSPTYAREIRTADYGVGMQELLEARADSLVGILNGVDTGVWNPSTDPELAQRYSIKSPWRKEKNKAALLQELGLTYRKGAPVFGMITRLTYQKGLDLLQEPLPELLEREDLRLVVLGSGEAKYERFFTGLEERFPERVRFWRGFNAALAHRIEGGVDFFLMPSLYEPCGLNQMYSRLYGTVPIVRKTGGLADTVELWDPETETGSGVVFDHPTPDGVRWAMRTALALYAAPKTWKKLVRATMDCDFSWDRAVRDYVAAYERAIKDPRVEGNA